MLRSLTATAVRGARGRVLAGARTATVSKASNEGLPKIPDASYPEEDIHTVMAACRHDIPLGDGFKVLDSLHRVRLPITEEMISGLLTACVARSRGDSAFRALKYFRDYKIDIEEKHIQLVLAAVAADGDSQDEAPFRFLEEVKRAGLTATPEMYSDLVEAYGAQGHPEGMLVTFGLKLHNGHVATTRDFESLMLAAADATVNSGSAAENIFTDLIGEHEVTPSPLCHALRAYSHSVHVAETNTTAPQPHLPGVSTEVPAPASTIQKYLEDAEAAFKAGHFAEGGASSEDTEKWMKSAGVAAKIASSPKDALEYYQGARKEGVSLARDAAYDLLVSVSHAEDCSVEDTAELVNDLVESGTAVTQSVYAPLLDQVSEDKTLLNKYVAEMLTKSDLTVRKDVWLPVMMGYAEGTTSKDIEAAADGIALEFPEAFDFKTRLRAIKLARRARAEIADAASEEFFAERRAAKKKARFARYQRKQDFLAYKVKKIAESQ